jgi:hypothetical protein
MHMPWKNLHGAPKVVAICAVVLLVSYGLCGVQMGMLGILRGAPTYVSGGLVIAGVIEGIAGLVAGLVGFIALLVWGFSKMLRRDGKS